MHTFLTSYKKSNKKSRLIQMDVNHFRAKTPWIMQIKVNFFVHYSYGGFGGNVQQIEFSHISHSPRNLSNSWRTKKNKQLQNYPSSHRLAMAAIQKRQRQPFTTTEYISPKATYKKKPKTIHATRTLLSQAEH